MVDNYAEAWVKAELGNAVHPYLHNIEGTTAREIFEDYSNEIGFEESDKLILHGAPSEEESLARYDLLEKTAFYLQSQGENPELYIPDVFEDDVQKSEVIHENSVNFMSPDVTEDEISSAAKEQSEGLRTHITSDYHAEGVYGLNEAFDDSTFTVLSADTSGEDFPVENYTSILGPFSPLADKMGDVGVSWETYAEGKELGRKLIDEIRGPRF